MSVHSSMTAIRVVMACCDTQTVPGTGLKATALRRCSVHAATDVRTIS